jgi:hypothetical protein
MCAYCMIGDFQFRHDPPFIPSQPVPYLPQPIAPLPQAWQPWGIAQLKEFQDLLLRVKALEDALGCPCEPNKADYIGMLKERIEALEKQQEAAKREGA